MEGSLREKVTFCVRRKIRENGSIKKFPSKGLLASPDCNVKIGTRDVIPYILYGGGAYLQSGESKYPIPDFIPAIYVFLKYIFGDIFYLKII